MKRRVERGVKCGVKRGARSQNPGVRLSTSGVANPVLFGRLHPTQLRRDILRRGWGELFRVKRGVERGVKRGVQRGIRSQNPGV